MPPLGEIDTTALIFALAVPGSLFFLIGVSSLFEYIGKGGLSDTHDVRASPAPGSVAAERERDEEIRQLLEAKNARRERRGEAPLDVEAELQRLREVEATRPAGGDAALREEVRQLVIARNQRRARRGEFPLDVEAEVERQLPDLGD